MDRATFNQYWRETEVIRQHQRMLFTFGDMQLPYLFACEHPERKDRVIILNGFVRIQKPTIIVPGYFQEEGPQFRDGFQDRIPSEVTSVFRGLGLPYCNIHNKLICEQKLEYGSLKKILDEYNQRLETENDAETGLIKGVSGGIEASLIRYFFELTLKSTPENVQEFMEHLRRQRGEPIRPDEKITDEDIARLFE